MQIMRVSSLVVAAFLSGCSSMPKQQALLERGAERPGLAYPVGRSVGENGVTCRYSDGTVVRRQNVATRCF